MDERAKIVAMLRQGEADYTGGVGEQSPPPRIYSGETKMILEHYSDKPLEWPPRTYKQHKHDTDGAFKPSGLWVSVKGEDDWPWWCEAEGFRLESLASRTIVRLKPEANLKLVQGESELDAFDAEYGVEWKLSHEFSMRRIDWIRLAKDYDGLIIAPYVWSRRLGGWDHKLGRKTHRISDWYYPWDCASGCLWNGDIIEAFETTP